MTQSGIGGKPESIYILSDGLRKLAEELDDAAGAVRRLKERSLESWWDTPGQLFAINLGSGSDRMHELADKVRELAGQLDETAGDLASAQKVMDSAVEHARQNQLDIIEDWLFEPPAPNDLVEMGVPAYDRRAPGTRTCLGSRPTAKLMPEWNRHRRSW